MTRPFTAPRPDGYAEVPPPIRARDAAGLRLPPGPRGLPGALLPRFLRDTPGFLLDLHRRYGDAASSARACTQPGGYVADDTDCDDGAASAYPGGAEVCDGLDNDCDGIIDETTNCYDDDGDGLGRLVEDQTPDGPLARVTYIQDDPPIDESGDPETTARLRRKKAARSSAVASTLVRTS